MEGKAMNDRKIKGVIFDLDGTLIDSYQAIYLSFQYAYEQMGLPPIAYEETQRVVGLGLTITFNELIGPERTPEALRLFRKRYDEVFADHTRFLPDARELTSELHRRGIRQAIATNKLGRFSRTIIKHFGMENLFVAILGDEDVSLNKPDPEMLLAAMGKMALAREEVVMVGDSLVDIQSAKNTGIRIFAVPSGVTKREVLEQARPTAVLDRLGDLLKYVG
jgi:HAD superfamily hydrolase (TIGR01662 family)